MSIKINQFSWWFTATYSVCSGARDARRQKLYWSVAHITPQLTILFLFFLNFRHVWQATTHVNSSNTRLQDEQVNLFFPFVKNLIQANQWEICLGVWDGNWVMFISRSVSLLFYCVLFQQFRLCAFVRQLQVNKCETQFHLYMYIYFTISTKSTSWVIYFWLSYNHQRNHEHIASRYQNYCIYNL